MSNTDDSADSPAGGETEFRVSPRQRRNLLVVAVFAFGIAVAAGFLAVRTRSWGISANIAAAAALCWLLSLYGYVAYTLAYTRFGPRGISGRCLAGRYEYRWEQIGNVARRAYPPRGATSRGATSFAIVLTTTDGDRLRLGAPVSNGLMGDPEFDVKYARVRRAWQAATDRTGLDADTKALWTRWLVLLVAGIVVQVVAASVIAGVVQVYAPAFRAHEGMGTHGVFTSRIRNCPQPGCTWFGQFQAAGGGGTRYATLAPGGPAITQFGVSVPAVDTGDAFTVYPAGGGTAWEGPAAGVAATGAVIIILLAAEITLPLYRARRRRRRARAGRARLGIEESGPSDLAEPARD